MKTFALACILALGASGLAAAAVTSGDVDYVQAAQHQALGQYAIGSLAKGKATDPTAKALAEQTVSVATAANEFIRTYAKSHDIQVDGKPSVRADMQYGNISSETGPTFDRDFAGALKIDASIALSAAQDEAQNGSDPALRNFAKSQAVKLQHILDNAGKLAH